MDVIVLLFHVKNVTNSDAADRVAEKTTTIVEYLVLLLLVSPPPLLLRCLLGEPISGEPTAAVIVDLSPEKGVRRICSVSSRRCSW